MKSTIYKNWLDLIKAERVDVEPETYCSSYGKFVCQPLERGYATTIGHALRRILMSSIQGAAITSVRFDGVTHEFTCIPGVMEDVTDIILNLKEVRLKLIDSETRTVIIEKKTKGLVTASDIKGSGYVEIMNPKQHICTITGKGLFRAELEVRWGKGYASSEKHIKADAAFGFIPIDAIFTPIRKVHYVVSQARVGQQTDYDKLSFEIYTDGSVLPEDALAYAAKILKDQLSVFINFDEDIAKPFNDDGLRSLLPHNDNLNKSVEDMELSVRSANCLKNADIFFIGQLVQRSEAEMLKTKNFGRKSLNEIKALLSQMDLCLGLKIDSWSPPCDKTVDNLY